MLVKSRRYFALSEYGAFLERALQVGIRFSLFDRERMTANQPRFHYLKHDIHADLRNTTKMAELEAKLNVPATFFMMHRHKLNRKFYDDPSTWEALRHIQSLGHEIALHIDGFVLIEKYWDLSLGVCEERNKFADERLRVRGGNTHGNSFYQTKLNFEPMNFYREVIRPNYCTDASWNKHYGRYSLADLGFEFWADTAVWFSPDTLIIPDTFVSDNSTEWKMGLGLEPDWLMASAPYSLPAEFADEMLPHIRDANCIYLIHPQFYSS